MSDFFKDESNLKTLKYFIQESSLLMASCVKDEDSVVFIGATKSGKSTLINYLLGNKLYGERINSFLPVSIRKTDNSLGPEIGCDSVSKTTIPSKYENSNKFPGLAIWDLPGNNDLRGVVQDIINGYYVYRLLTYVKSIKIVLVCDISDIVTDNIEPFLTLLNTIENIFGDKMENCFSSTVIVFAKVPDILNGVSFDSNTVVDLLNYKILSSTSLNISTRGKNFVNYIIQNKQNIGYFKRPKVGKVTDDVCVNIIEAINNISSVKKSDLRSFVRPNIAHSSKVFLYQNRLELTESDAIVGWYEQVNETFDNMIKTYSELNEKANSNEKLMELLIELKCQNKHIDNIVNLGDLHEKICTIGVLDSVLNNYVDSKNLIEKVELLLFTDTLLQLEECKSFKIHFNQILILANSKIKELIINLELSMNKITAEEKERISKEHKKDVEDKISHTKDELEKIKEHNDNVCRQLGFFGKMGKTVDDTLKASMEFFSNISSKI